MKIDAHVHLDIARYKGVRQAAVHLVKEMDSAGVDKAIIFPDNNLNKNAEIDQACRILPDRLLGFGMIDPRLSAGSIKDGLNKLRDKKWFKGVKLHPRAQKFNIKLKGVFVITDHLGELGLPLAIDCFPSLKGTALENVCFPLQLNALAKSSPSTNIIMAHMGGHRLLDAYIVAMGNPNVILDVSFTFYYYEGASLRQDMEFILKKLSRDKVIYGSDYPSIGIKKGIKTFQGICSASRIDSASKKNVFGNTVSKLIGL